MSLARSLAGVSRETKLVVGLVGGAEFVNHTYLVLFPPILGLLAAEFDVGLAALGLAIGVQGATNAAFQLPFGHLSDRYDRRLVLGLSLAISTGSVFLIAAAPSYELLLVGQALLGVGVAGHHPVHFPLLAAATSERHRGRAFSVRGFLGSLGFGAPPAVVTAAVAVPGLTWRHAVAAIGLFGAVYTVLTLVAFRRYVGRSVTAPTETDGDGDGDRTDASPPILALALLALVSSTASWGLTSYVVVLLRDGYGLSLGIANLALTALFVVGAVTVLVGGDLADRIAAGPVLVASYASVAVVVAGLASFVVPPAAAVGAVLLVGGLRSLAGPARSKLADALSARADLGRTFATVTVGTMVGNAVAPPLFGALIERSGLRVAFLLIAAVSALAVGVTLAVLRGHGERPDASEPESEPEPDGA